jgi:hypothetical protein
MQQTQLELLGGSQNVPNFELTQWAIGRAIATIAAGISYANAAFTMPVYQPLPWATG